MTLGDLIKAYRDKHNISMDEFSKRSGISKGYISMLEKNEHPKTKKEIMPTLPLIKKVANALNQDFNEIIKLIDGETTVLLENTIDVRNNPSKILDYYEQLNSTGKQEAEKRVKELTCIPEYTVPDYLQPIAAHTDDDSEENRKAIEEEFDDF